MSVSNAIVRLGPCCICETTCNVLTIATLDRRCPTPGKGWGCFQCDLPMDGAFAVLCNRCADDWQAGRAEMRFVCRGEPGKDGRIPFADLSPEPFGHDMSRHPEEMLQ